MHQKVQSLLLCIGRKERNKGKYNLKKKKKKKKMMAVRVVLVASCVVAVASAEVWVLAACRL